MLTGELDAETGRYRPVYPDHQALALIGMGETDRAIEAIKKLPPSGPVRVGMVLAVPELDAVRDDPCLKGLRRDVGLFLPHIGSDIRQLQACA